MIEGKEGAVSSLDYYIAPELIKKEDK